MSVDAERRFARALLILRGLRPFYAAVFQVIQKLEDERTPALAVTESELLYNRAFVESVSFERLMFLLLHGVAHIALRHVPRRQGRDAALWNAAADLYVNKLLAEEFWLKGPGSLSPQTGAGCSVEMPEDSLFEPSVDLREDFVEKIYASFEAQGRENGYFEAVCDSAVGFGYRGGGKQSRGTQKAEEPSVISITPGGAVDLLERRCPAEMATRANRVMTDAAMRLDMDSSAGTADCRLRVLVEEMRRAPLSWRSLLQKYLRQTTDRDSSFLCPDRRMLWQRAIYPGRCAGERNRLQGLKICVDTSGSIRHEDAAMFCGQIYEMARQFGLEAELIYWDVAIQGRGELKKYKDIRAVEALGGGGTDPACLFRYFDGAQCKIKPLLSVVFTDGVFNGGWDESVWRRRYRDTIWVLDKKNYYSFTPPFGKKAAAGQDLGAQDLGALPQAPQTF